MSKTGKTLAFFILTFFLIGAVSALGPVYAYNAINGSPWVRTPIIIYTDESPSAICAAYGWTNTSNYLELKWSAIGYTNIKQNPPNPYGWQNPGIGTNYPGSVNQGTVSGSRYYGAWTASCSGAGPVASVIHQFFANNESIPVENATSDFIGLPLVATAPNIITLTDTSTGPVTEYNWTGSGPGDMFFSSLTNRNTTVYLTTAGYYNISHGVKNAIGSDIKTKTDYIYIYDDNSTSITGCLAVNGATGMRIGGAQVDLYDVENTSWTNTTTTEGLGVITTLKGHTIDCYGTAVGFSPGDLLAQPEKNLGFYTLNLWPSVGYKNVSAGYVTLYITVTDISTGNPIAGATVSGGGKNYGVLLNSSAFSLTTNEQGMASVPVPNGTFIYMTAYKSGYSTQTAAVDTGTGSGGDAKVTYWFKMSKATTGPTAAITTLPGGGYPTTSPTVDPAGTPDPSGKGGGGYSTAKGQQMMDYLAQNGMDLVQLCFIVTILALVGVKFGK